MSENRSLQSATTDSEDRLFDLLRRPTFTDMRRLYTVWAQGVAFGFSTKERHEFFKSHGWTVQDFLDMHHMMQRKLPHD